MSTITQRSVRRDQQKRGLLPSGAKGQPLNKHPNKVERFNADQDPKLTGFDSIGQPIYHLLQLHPTKGFRNTRVPAP